MRRAITYKVVDNSERHRAIQTSRTKWDEISDLVKEGKTVLISGVKYCSVIRTSLASRGIKGVTASKRGENTYIVWTKQPVKQFESLSEPVAEMEQVKEFEYTNPFAFAD